MDGTSIVGFGTLTVVFVAAAFLALRYGKTANNMPAALSETEMNQLAPDRSTSMLDQFFDSKRSRKY